MQNWANSFGTFGAQVAKTLQDSIMASFASLNQYLVTGKFNAQQLLQQLALLALQLIEQLAIQEVMAAFRTKEAAKSAAEGVAVAAASAPGTAAKSVSQYGPVVGAVLGVAAIGAIIAAVLGAFHEGGPIMRRRKMHSGGMADDVPILAQEGEFMVRRSVVQQPGMAAFLTDLNAGMIGGFQQGGVVTARGIQSFGISLDYEFEAPGYPL